MLLLFFSILACNTSNTKWLFYSLSQHLTRLANDFPALFCLTGRVYQYAHTNFFSFGLYHLNQLKKKKKSIYACILIKKISKKKKKKNIFSRSYHKKKNTKKKKKNFNKYIEKKKQKKKKKKKNLFKFIDKKKKEKKKKKSIYAC